LTEFKTDLI